MMLKAASLFTTSFMVALTGAMAPGSLLVVTIARAAEDGFWTAPLLMLGHAAAEIITVYLLVRGAGKFLKKPAVFGVIALAGGTILLWMGYGTFSYGGDGTSAITAGPGPGLPDPLAGMVFSLTNPYWTIWWATIGTTYVAMAQERGKTGIAVFFTGHILGDVAWYCLVAALVTAGIQFLSGPVYRGTLMALSFVLWGMGIYFIYSGIRSLVKSRL
jgi:threonine/homoserine/homoserine lactone efflux protein